MAAFNKPRQRAWKPKSRTGCATCKARRVKCGEERPQCVRCTSTGRTCDGYNNLFQFSSYARPSASEQPSRKDICIKNRGLIKTASPIHCLSIIKFNSDQERESFDFFVSYAVYSLRGFLDSSFWQRELLQATQQIPAIRHCVAALSAMHRKYYEGDGSYVGETTFLDRQLEFALRQSNAAIRALVRQHDHNTPMAQADRVTFMTCSILFSSMACLQGRQGDAYEHLRSGIRMLNEMDTQASEATKSCHPVTIESLRALFVGLDQQVRGIRPSRNSKDWVPTPKAESMEVLPTSEINMGTLPVLLRYQESLLNSIFAFHHSIVYRSAEEAADIQPRYHDLLLRSHRGAAALTRLLHQFASTSTGEFSAALTTLALQQCQIEYILRSPRPDIESKFHLTASLTNANNPYVHPFDPAAHFSQMYHLAARLLPTRTADNRPPRPVFTITTGPLSALYLIIMRAPSSCNALRRQALGLILSHPRREGFWDGRIAGRMAQTLMEIEQQSARKALGLAGDSATLGDIEVPQHLRVIAVMLGEAEGEKSGRVEYLTQADVEAGRKGFVRK